MIKQTEGVQSKVGEYRFWCRILPFSFLPASITTTIGPEPSTSLPGYIISGSICKEDGQFILTDPNHWPYPPHVEFANLLVDDPKAVEAFIRRYGLLSDLSRYDPEDAKFTGREHMHISFKEGQPQYEIVGRRPYFEVEGHHVDFMQDELRGAWEQGGANADDLLERLGAGIAVTVDLESSSIVLRPRDLWTLICFLFWRDFMAGKLGICGNPNCPAPYFRKKRNTQKCCEQGPCVQYAQQQRSLDWWRREGKKRREERQRQHRKERQRRVGKHSAKRSKR